MNEAAVGRRTSRVGSSMRPERNNCGISELPLDLSISWVYRQILVVWRFRSVFVTRSHCVRIVPAVLGFFLASLCLAACGGSEASTSTTVDTTPTTKAIATAWLAAQRAFHNAALTSDANSPELADAMISPQLDRARTNLATFASRGYRARGVTHYGNEVVRSQSPDRASVVSCAVDDEIEFEADTGKPVSGVLGKPSHELISSVMRKTSTGWKLADQTIAVGGCTGS
jgi:hypothetical protein